MWKQSYRLTKLFRNSDYKGPLKVALTIKSRIEKFKINLPLIQVLCNPGLKPRHWDSMNKILGIDITPNEQTSLKDILVNSKIIEKHLEKLAVVSEEASKEYALEQALKKMKADWELVNFVFMPYKETSLSLFASFDELQALLDDHFVKTTTMKNSPFVVPFEKEVNEWVADLVKN